MKTTILYEVVPHPERRYKMVRFIHPLHGIKYIGCMTETEIKRGAVAENMERFARNCGQTVEAFDFINKKGD